MRKISFLFLLVSFTLFIYSCQKEQDCTCQNKESSPTEEKNSKGKSNDTHHNSSNEQNDRIRPAYSYSLDQSTAWKMKWHDEFEGNQFNQHYWTKIPRGHSPWNKYMSFNENCYEVSNGTIKLKGIVSGLRIRLILLRGSLKLGLKLKISREPGLHFGYSTMIRLHGQMVVRLTLWNILILKII